MFLSTKEREVTKMISPVKLQRDGLLLKVQGYYKWYAIIAHKPIMYAKAKGYTIYIYKGRQYPCRFSNVVRVAKSDEFKKSPYKEMLQQYIEENLHKVEKPMEILA